MAILTKSQSHIASFGTQKIVLNQQQITSIAHTG